jgi:hypothetical protein
MRSHFLMTSTRFTSLLRFGGIRHGWKSRTCLITHNHMAALSAPLQYERNRSTYQHLIWFTLEWIRLLLNCSQFQKIVKPICEHFFTRNRKLYTLIKSLQRVTRACGGDLSPTSLSGFSTASIVASLMVVYFLLFWITFLGNVLQFEYASRPNACFVISYLIALEDHLLQVLIYCQEADRISGTPHSKSVNILSLISLTVSIHRVEKC